MREETASGKCVRKRREERSNEKRGKNRRTEKRKKEKTNEMEGKEEEYLQRSRRACRGSVEFHGVLAFVGLVDVVQLVLSSTQQRNLLTRKYQTQRPFLV